MVPKATKCGACGRPMAKGAQFCGFCGAKLLDRCPKCGNTDLSGPNFCTRCGASLRATEGSGSGTGRTDGRAASDEDLEAELNVYKASWEEGQNIITCPYCGAKNRIPNSKLQLSPSCGRCKKVLPVS